MLIFENGWLLGYSRGIDTHDTSDYSVRYKKDSIGVYNKLYVKGVKK